MKDLLKRLLPYGEIDINSTFSKLTTFKVGGPVGYLAYPRDAFALQAIINICEEENVPYKVLGNGSNLLCSDDPFDGVVIKLNHTFNQVYYGSDCVVEAQAGCSIISLALDVMKMGLSGLEFASGIPGTVGGCIYMNAGAYKSSMSEVITEVQVLQGREIVWLSNAECGFSYRKSIFQQHPEWVILAARFQLKPGDSEEIKDLMQKRQQRRFETQPLNMPCAGSVFRNREEHFAWEYVDMIGYRGKNYGGALVSPKHSNFIVNSGEATADEINSLITDIQNKVYEQFGVELIMEVEKFNWQK